MTATVDSRAKQGSPNAGGIRALITHSRYDLIQQKRPKRKNGLGGQRNLLKRLISDKEIQVFFLEKFGWSLGWLGWILKNLESALKNQISAWVQARRPVSRTPATSCAKTHDLGVAKSRLNS